MSISNNSIQSSYPTNQINNLSEIDNLSESDASPCAICLGDLGTNLNDIKILPCDHQFHAQCIDQWLEIRNTCPVCRAEVDLVQQRAKVGIVRMVAISSAALGVASLFIGGSRIIGARLLEDGSYNASIRFQQSVVGSLVLSVPFVPCFASANESIFSRWREIAAY